MRRSHKLAIGFICVLLLLILSACGKFDLEHNLYDETSNMLDDIQLAENYLQEYMSVRMTEGAKKACEYVHFENDWEAEVYSQSINPLESYEILSSEKINDSLFAFYMEFKTAANREMGETTKGFNFVAVLDDEYQIITNVRNIPYDIFDGDRSRFSNDTENTVQPEEVIGISLS